MLAKLLTLAGILITFWALLRLVEAHKKRSTIAAQDTKLSRHDEIETITLEQDPKTGVFKSSKKK
ncbi:MAG: hypothetical protein COB90_00710 [Hyphomicrobiales bacterium]|nr:MAG: hypothetical protein COB90_00710 [Hyphomicrobiales bacterium]